MSSNWREMVIGPGGVAGGAGEQVVIPVEDEEVSLGNSFFTANSDTLADDATLDMWIKTGAKDFHCNVNIIVPGVCEVQFYEAASLTGGVQMTPSNLNAQSSNTPTHQIYRDPSVTATGTSLIPSTGSSSTTGLYLPEGISLIFSTYSILEINEDYLIRLHNRDGASGEYGLIIYGYELVHVV